MKNNLSEGFFSSPIAKSQQKIFKDECSVEFEKFMKGEQLVEDPSLYRAAVYFYDFDTAEYSREFGSLQRYISPDFLAEIKAYEERHPIRYEDMIGIGVEMIMMYMNMMQYDKMPYECAYKYTPETGILGHRNYKGKNNPRNYSWFDSWKTAEGREIDAVETVGKYFKKHASTLKPIYDRIVAVGQLMPDPWRCHHIIEDKRYQANLRYNSIDELQDWWISIWDNRRLH